MTWKYVEHKDKPYVYDDGGRCREFNIKPLKKNQIGDCVVRSIAIGLDQSYRRTLDELCSLSMEKGGVPNDPRIYEPYLESKGWIKNKPPKIRQPNSVCYRNPHGVYRKVQLRNLHLDRAIILTSGHLTAMINGVVMDIWNCSRSCANSYYTPKPE
jgi:hypothetical protein